MNGTARYHRTDGRWCADQNTTNFGAGDRSRLSTGSARAGCKSGVDYVQELVQNLVRFYNLLAALLTLLIGLLIAAVARAVVRESSIALT